MIDYSLTTNDKFLQLYHGKSNLLFGEITMMYAFVQDQHTELDSFIVIAHWYNSPRIVMRLHSDTIKWFSANKGNNKITKLRTILQRESQNS